MKFASALRNGSADYLAPSQQLYDWILRPIETFAADRHIDTLIIVPDSSLRLVAMSALHDGKQFAIEKFAISTVTGLSMTNTNVPPTRQVESLIAGASEFGSVVDKLTRSPTENIVATDVSANPASRKLESNRNLRSTEGLAVKSAADDRSGTRGVNGEDRRANTEALRKSLELPGVADEIQAVGRIMPGSTTLLNSAFTVNAFSRDAGSGSYRVLHIATHGVFGGSGDASYILAYDDVLTLNGLQALLKSDRFQNNPIELMTLSACETAEGNDRAPLGIAGASIKARAKSVIGTLWPVDDTAARRVMEKFYVGITTGHLTKTEALRQAQIELIHQDEFSHPSFWAPFDLIGNWL
jgi:CHAT domain-containing protein